MSESTDHPWPARSRRLRVGELQVDLRYRQLLGPEGEVELPQRVFELLLLFLAEPHVLHSRAALFERVWPAVVVEDANLSQSIWMLRKALGPDRKQWIRTVAGSGYVFEPPGPVEAEAVAEETPVPQVDRPAAEASPTLPWWHPRRYPRRAAHVLGAGLLAALALVTVLAIRSATPEIPASLAADGAPVAVALIEVGGDSDGDARWPATVLRAWLEWKLQSLPEVTVLTEGHLAADAAALSPQIVLLSAGRSSQAPGERFVRAQFSGRNGALQLELRGTAAEMPALIDSLSREVLDELVPGRTASTWPDLGLDASAATGFATAYRLIERRDLASGSERLRTTVSQAPRFGLGHLHLATSLSRLGQANAAVEQMALARQALQPLPDDAARVLEARSLAMDPGRAAEAADAFDTLARQHAGRLDFRLDQASHRLRAGDPEAAWATLDEVAWEKQPTSVRIRWRLIRAEIASTQSNLESVREEAEKAIALARSAGDAWKHEHARALHLKALADAYQYGPEADMEQFSQASRLFSEAGAEMEALFATVSGELAQPPRNGTGPSADFSRLLARARAEGHLRVEVMLLRRAAFQHYMAGDLPRYRGLLEEAHASAQAAGDTIGQQALDVDLLNEDVMIGRFDSALERIRRIRAGGMRGSDMLWLDQFEAFILATRGDFQGALNALDHTARRLQREGRPPLPEGSIARLACSRAEIMLSRGEMHQARAATQLCRSADRPGHEEMAMVLEAAIDLLAGDPATASERLDHVIARVQALPQAPDRWLASLQTGYLLSRAGRLREAGTLYREVRDTARDTGYDWLMVIAESGLAELAAADGRSEDARRHEQQARQYMHGEAWAVTHRLDVVARQVALDGSDAATAAAILERNHERAHRIGDVIAQLELHSLVPDGARLGDCDPATRAAQVAATGMRGATLDWMTGMSAPGPAGSTAAGEAGG
ncbi:winged helix-turn-helix domain-containing protein [Novilysobacter spongiicola]|uniref:DNA-binding winged helix-turn-helix (WHTH) domain-containing protein n=1 Tax=Lysobacter spongiicola DSM 21749 TaxID=1122188 RepID=A0A1T4PUX8_9GAMM|nr:winged helix-turn-helix domain-containing protein [Lysobacter spongiicola]SJZ94748.1 DNA-binding winged helix-turn-helix (wHTH) domain-containing protein [Lysobacter spongiicola DSM 21749]